MTKTHLELILEKALRAPSADNCQPWMFKWDGKTLSVFHDAQRAEHPLSPLGLASVLSLGTLLESIELAASEFGYKPCWSLKRFENKGICLWAEVHFEPIEVKKNPLSDMLLTRFTDRRIYQGGDLSPFMFQKRELDDARLHLLSKPSKELIDYIIHAEQLLVDHPKILPATMAWARLTSSQAHKTRDGVSWQGFGAKFWEVPMIPIIRNFPAILRLTKHMVGPQHRSRVIQQLRSSAGLVCVSAPIKNLEKDQEKLVTSGRLAMNAWLSLTACGYGVQPLTFPSTVSIFANHGIVELSEEWLRFFKGGEEILRRSFGFASDASPVWMLRTGLSGPQPKSCKTLRKHVSQVLKFES